jgi:MarR family transcriptional regulator, organic hydroperoxide resistance regulator
MQLTAEGCDGGTGELDSEIFDAMTELTAGLTAVTGQVARHRGLPEFCLRALLELAEPTTMGDLGRRMRCDPSFVTITADILEKRGLARRESSTSDRRVKNLVLTPQGTAAREQAHRDLLASMPWLRLGEDERTDLLALVRKMIRAQSRQADAAALHRRATG